jgi:hypothetical protein
VHRRGGNQRHIVAELTAAEFHHFFHTRRWQSAADARADAAAMAIRWYPNSSASLFAASLTPSVGIELSFGRKARQDSTFGMTDLGLSATLCYGVESTRL